MAGECAVEIDFGDTTFGQGLVTSQEGFVDELGTQLLAMIKVAAHRGDQAEAVKVSVTDIHTTFNSELGAQVGLTNTYPILVATNGSPGFEEAGTSFTLYRRDGSSDRFPAENADFEVYRSLARTPLGLFGLVAPYFKAPKSTNWITTLNKTLTNVRSALEAVKEAPASFKAVGEFTTQYLTVVEKFITTSVESKTVTRESFQEFGKEIYPLFVEGVKKAVSIQVNTSIPAIKKIKESLGDDEWRALYVVIPAQWGGVGQNPRKQIFQHLMDKDRVDSHIIVTEKAVTIEQARGAVGSVLVNRAFAQVFFFGQESQESNNYRFSFSTQRDWFSDACVVAIEEFDALKVDVEVKTTNVFDVPEDDDEEEPEEDPEKPKKPKEKLPGFTSELVEI